MQPANSVPAQSTLNQPLVAAQPNQEVANIPVKQEAVSSPMFPLNAPQAATTPTQSAPLAPSPINNDQPKQAVSLNQKTKKSLNWLVISVAVMVAVGLLMAALKAF